MVVENPLGAAETATPLCRNSDAADANELPSLVRLAAYAAPEVGSSFFYVPIWSILPGIYSKYFGLGLDAIAAVVLFNRLFDGVIDAVVGLLADRHRAKGGSRKPWVFAGSLGGIFACYFLFQPSHGVTIRYYFAWSLVYFVFFSILEIPHTTWGSELATDYHDRARVFAGRNLAANLGVIIFYTLPLIWRFGAGGYDPAIMRISVYVGAALILCGLAWAIVMAPVGRAIALPPGDSLKQYVEALTRNRPLHLYLAAFGFVGLSAGMWFSLAYVYLDSYLGLGKWFAPMFLIGTIAGSCFTPACLALIRRFGKPATWCIGIGLFCLQLLGMDFMGPGASPWIVGGLVLLANLFVCCHNVCSFATLGDIADYGMLRFRKDRSATYFAINTLAFKVGLGFGGGLALAAAGWFGFSPASPTHTAHSILGLKIGFIFMPMIASLLGVVLVLLTPIDPRRHRIIRKRIATRTIAR